MSTRTHFDSEGKSVTLTLSAAIEAREAVYVNGWLGIAVTDGESGDNRAITIAREEYQFQIPNSLDPAVGAIVYVTLASVVGHSIPPAALSLTSGAGKRALFKTTAARYGGADDWYVPGILLLDEV